MSESLPQTPSNDEMIEAWDWETLSPTGRAVSRKKAHKEGIPHEGVQLWITRLFEGQKQLLFQHRSPDKELYPDCLDITVAGHVIFGQNEKKISKEAYEEIGIRINDSDCFDLGYSLFDEKVGDYWHREIQRVFMIRDDRPLSGYNFHDGEVTAIYALGLEDLTALLEKDKTVQMQAFDGKKIYTIEAKKTIFHPLFFNENMKHYMNTVIIAAKELIDTGNIQTGLQR